MKKTILLACLFVLNCKAQEVNINIEKEPLQPSQETQVITEQKVLEIPETKDVINIEPEATKTVDITNTENNTLTNDIKENNINDFAKVIIYRGTTHNYATHRPAKIYLNDKSLVSLYKNEYVEFCIPAGKNTITSHLESNIIYSSKNKKNLLADFNAGSVYFLRINDDLNGSGEIYQEVDKKLDSEIKGKVLKSVNNEYIKQCQKVSQINIPLEVLASIDPDTIK